MKEDKYDFIMKWNGASGGGGTGSPTKTIYVKEPEGIEVCRLCEIPYWQIEQIADAVVRKLKEKEEVSTFKPMGGRGGE